MGKPHLRDLPFFCLFTFFRHFLCQFRFILYLCSARRCETAYARPLMQASWRSLNRSFVARKTRKERSMQTIVATENVQLTLPNADLSFLRTISKKMGWSLKTKRKSGIEKGLEDIQKGNVYHAKNSEDLIKQILG